MIRYYYIRFFETLCYCTIISSSISLEITEKLNQLVMKMDYLLDCDLINIYDDSPINLIINDLNKPVMNLKWKSNIQIQHFDPMIKLSKCRIYVVNLKIEISLELLNKVQFIQCIFSIKITIKL